MENNISSVPVLKVKMGNHLPEISRWMLVFCLIGLILHLLVNSILFFGYIFVLTGIFDPTVGVYLNKIPFNQVSACISLIFFVFPLIVCCIKSFNRL